MTRSAGAAGRDYFALFQLPPTFELDLTQLDHRYRALLREFHPDRYAGKPQVEQRVAAQLCADVTAGYEQLRRDVSRAEYLLARAGVDLQAAERRGVGTDFLLTQMSLREQMESWSAMPSEQRTTFLDEVTQYFAQSRAGLSEALATQAWDSAATHWLELCYLSKLLEELGVIGSGAS